mgnify:CR=1 FL=1
MILFPELNTCVVAVIGLGYVGLPLAVEFAKPQPCRRTGTALQRRVIGFDVNGQQNTDVSYLVVLSPTGETLLNTPVDTYRSLWKMLK